MKKGLVLDGQPSNTYLLFIIVTVVEIDHAGYTASHALLLCSESAQRNTYRRVGIASWEIGSPIGSLPWISQRITIV